MTAARGRFAGTLQIVRYNLPFYVGGSSAIVAGATFAVLAPLPTWAMVVVWCGVTLAAWWLIGSLVASFWIYDASDTMDFDWLDLPEGEQWVNLHAGLDESTPRLTQRLGRPASIFDFFDAKEMTEPSIQRARSLAQNSFPATPVNYRHLPSEDSSLDLVTIVFAAHELRAPESRDAFFMELRRVLRTGGRIVVIEHLRDSPNFIVFGPGFMHFMPRSEWHRLADGAGLSVVSEVRRTPFVVAFTMEKR